MSYRLRVRIKNTEGTMVRLLGVVQRRNYHLLGVTAVLTPDSPRILLHAASINSKQFLNR